MTEKATPSAFQAERNYLSIVVGVGAGLFSQVVVDWPFAFLMVGDMSLASLAFGAITGLGVYLVIPRPETAQDVAVKEFLHLGVSPDTITQVILANRMKANALIKRATDMHSPTNAKLVRDIGSAVLTVINEFQQDPSDIARSRSTLAATLDQASKIVENYMVIERRKNTLADGEYVGIAVETEYGLKTILHTLEDLRRRNLDNNKVALRVDLDVSQQIFDKR